MATQIDENPESLDSNILSDRLLAVKTLDLEFRARFAHPPYIADFNCEKPHMVVAERFGRTAQTWALNSRY